METLLQVQGLKKYFPVQRGFFQKVIGWIKAVDGVDFRIEKGKTLGLVGESGCGKSTIGRLILRLLDPDNGKILYRDQDLGILSQQELKPLRKEMQIIFQDPFGSLNPRMNVGQSIEEGLRTLGVKSYSDRQTRVKELLETHTPEPLDTDVAVYLQELMESEASRYGMQQQPGFQAQSSCLLVHNTGHICQRLPKAIKGMNFMPRLCWKQHDSNQE